MRGLREKTSDIDLELPVDVFQSLVKGYGLETQVFSNGITLAVWDDFIDIHACSDVHETLPCTADVHCASLHSVLKLKQDLNRPKDQKDIRILRNALGA